MVYKNFVTLFITVILLSSMQINAASSERGVSVLMSIESHDRTMARGYVYAYTFQEAVQRLAGKNGLDIVYVHDGRDRRIHSVNGVENRMFNASDGWHGFIQRGENIIAQTDMLNVPLQEGDVVVLYYGDPDETTIVSRFEHNIQNGRSVFSLSTVDTVRIHVQAPGGGRMVLQTNEQGIAGARFDSVGMAFYHAEGYINGNVPSIVRTLDKKSLVGYRNTNRLTRGEVVSFIVNTFDIGCNNNSNSNDKNDKNKFSDVSSSTSFAREINRAFAAGLVTGFEDGSFRPYNSITAAHFSVLLSRLDGFYDDNEFNLSTDPDAPVTAAMLEQIYAKTQ